MIGIPVIPIFLVTLFAAGIFGKVAVLGWIGGRCLGKRPGQTPLHPALAVLLGGVVVMLAYLVPVLGFLVYILLSMIGYGAVLYALLNRFRRASSGSAGPHAGATASPAYAAHADAAMAAEPPTAPAAPLPPTTLPRPGFWPRIGALFIDAIVVGVLVRLLLDGHDGGDAASLVPAGLAVYGAVMWKLKSTTIGGIVSTCAWCGWTRGRWTGRRCASGRWAASCHCARWDWASSGSASILQTGLARQAGRNHRRTCCEGSPPGLTGWPRYLAPWGRGRFSRSWRRLQHIHTELNVIQRYLMGYARRAEVEIAVGEQRQRLVLELFEQFTRCAFDTGPHQFDQIDSVPLGRLRRTVSDLPDLIGVTGTSTEKVAATPGNGSTPSELIQPPD